MSGTRSVAFLAMNACGEILNAAIDYSACGDVAIEASVHVLAAKDFSKTVHIPARSFL